MLTTEQIATINSKCPYNQGIFKEPSNIPVDIKEAVIYMKWESSGRPGSCHDDENTINEHYENSFELDNFKALKLTLEALNKPMPTDIHTIINHGNEFDDTSNGYYGDYENYTPTWIKLSDLYKILKLN